MKKILSTILVIVMIFAVFSSSAFAKEAKIDENITMYVTVKAGGALDVRARILADYLTKDLGVNVTVENLPGAGGLTCATQMFTNPSGPYDMMFTAASTFTAGPVFEESCIYTIDDFRAVGLYDGSGWWFFLYAESY